MNFQDSIRYRQKQKIKVYNLKDKKLKKSKLEISQKVYRYRLISKTSKNAHKSNKVKNQKNNLAVLN